MSTTLTMLCALLSTAAAFVPPCTRVDSIGSRSSVQMQTALPRRQLLQTAGAALATLPAFEVLADGANSAQQVTRARAIYGSRIFRLLSKGSADIAAEKNAFTLFISGAYRTLDQKDTAKALTKLASAIVSAAEKGDEATAKSNLKEFVAKAKITELDAVEGGNWDPKQRRNLGAPPTREIELQMGTEAFALYRPVK